VNLNIKVSKILYHWILLLNPFCFCETQYLHFTTRVFGHCAISPFLGGLYKLGLLSTIITHSAQPKELFCSACWLRPPAFIAPFERARSYAPLHQFVHGFCMSGFVCDFFFSDLLLLLHIWGTGFWVILVLFIFVCCSVFCEFLDFLHFWNVSGRMLRIPGFSQFSRISRAGWFLFCPVCRFVTVPTVLGGLAVRRHNNKKIKN